MKKITLQDNKLEMVKANISSPCGDKEYFTRDEVIGIVNSMYDGIMATLYSMHEFHNNKTQDIVNQINDSMASHCEGHLPKMHEGQIKSLLTSAGIIDDFEQEKPSITSHPHYVFSSIEAQKEVLKGIKLEFK